MNNLEKLAKSGLYSPDFEKDNCGFGLIAQMDGRESHSLVETAITALNRMTHRGAIAADGKSGDGCGLLLRKPERFLRNCAAQVGLKLGAEFATGIVFLPREEELATRARLELEQQLRNRGLRFNGWRVVPVNSDACGEQARESLPRIEQIFVSASTDMDDAEFNRHLFVARRRTEMALADLAGDFYVCSLSSEVILYKGLVMPGNLSTLFEDLQDEMLESSVAVFHQRFSTNTLPQWHLAQPFRYLAHNGEINTIQGNRNWAAARADKLRSDVLPELGELRPLVSNTGSDSPVTGQYAGGPDCRRHGYFSSTAFVDATGLAEHLGARLGPACLSGIQFYAYGTLGWACRSGIDRRSLRLLRAGQKRSATGSLRHYPGSPHHPRLGNRRLGLSQFRSDREGAPRPG